MDQQLHRLMGSPQEIQKQIQGRQMRRQQAKLQKKAAKNILERDDVGADVARRAKENLQEAGSAPSSGTRAWARQARFQCAMRG